MLDHRCAVQEQFESPGWYLWMEALRHKDGLSTIVHTEGIHLGTGVEMDYNSLILRIYAELGFSNK